MRPCRQPERQDGYEHDDGIVRIHAVKLAAEEFSRRGSERQADYQSQDDEREKRPGAQDLITSPRFAPSAIRTPISVTRYLAL